MGGARAGGQEGRAVTVRDLPPVPAGPEDELAELVNLVGGVKSPGLVVHLLPFDAVAGQGRLEARVVPRNLEHTADRDEVEVDGAAARSILREVGEPV